MATNILSPYQASQVYEEEIFGEFENQFEAQYCKDFLNSTGKGLVLDLACGDGRHTLRLSEKADYVIAVDLSPNNLRMAWRKCQGKENIAFIEASMLDLPFRENIFEGIWFSQAFEYIAPDRRLGFLLSARRILKPRGVLYMSVETWMYPSLSVSLKELWSNFRLYLYWKLVKRKPLLWGEFLYYLSSEKVGDRISRWHYHVHTDKWTLLRVLGKSELRRLKLDLHDGYFYALCERAVT